jgi:hypothetical protein
MSLLTLGMSRKDLTAAMWSGNLQVWEEARSKLVRYGKNLAKAKAARLARRKNRR